MLLYDVIYLKSKNVKLNTTSFRDIYLCYKITKKSKEMIDIKFRIVVHRGRDGEAEE